MAPNLNAVLVGETAKARKGSADSRIRDVFQRAESDSASTRIKGGLSSGEGLLWAVRDPDGDDLGVADKRLLCVEPEFSAVLKVMARDTNTLSALMRQAWDRGDLRAMTKNSPAVATGAHISIVGHITKGELTRYLTETEMGNGFPNRFLWICAERAQVLPEGGGSPDYEAFVPALQGRITIAAHIGRLDRDDQTREAWAKIYPDLSEGKLGLFGAVTARSEAQVLRLSVLYAALDSDTAIRLHHLEAALAVWEYAERSARYILGDATGNPVADRILEGLRLHGEMTRTQISQLVFQRNTTAARIAQALRLLASRKMATDETRQTQGRSVEVWRAI